MRISDWSSDVCSSDLVYGARFEACLCNFLYGINLQGYAGNRPRLAQTLTIADHHRPATFVYLFRCQAFHNDFGTHPAASPMVMAIIGRYIVLPILSDFVTHTRYFLSDWRHAPISAAFAQTLHHK